MTVWVDGSGSISFGLVNIPIKLYPATKERRIEFHSEQNVKCGPERAQIAEKLIEMLTTEFKPGDHKICIRKDLSTDSKESRCSTNNTVSNAGED